MRGLYASKQGDESMSNGTFVSRPDAEARDFEASLTEVQSAVGELGGSGAAAQTSAFCHGCHGCHGCHSCHGCG